ncbi:unnamed protein product, partial [Darwinula stevensoni]
VLPKSEKTEFREGYQEARIQVMLSIAYSAGIGGTGTITGTATNLIFMAILDELYGPDTGLNYGTWMAFSVPGLLLNAFIAWLWLQALFFFAQWRERRKHPERQNQSKAECEEELAQEERAARAVICKKYSELGSMSFHEFMTLSLFITLVLLWLSRDPQFVPGWAAWIKGDRDLGIGDGTAAMLIVFVFFIIPAKPDFWCFHDSSDSPSKSSEALLNWRVLHEKMPWGLLLLIGAGFAIAKASEASCLSYWVGQQMATLGYLSPAALVFIMTIMTTLITNVASNTATVTIVMPVLAQLANVLKVNPLYLMLPSAIACSYAFMLPVATPYNAIVYEVSKMKTTTMMKAGAVMNVVCVLVINMTINTLGNYIFDFSTFPEWAVTASNSSASSSHCNYTLY